jgi:hypothetical protein
MDPIKILPHHAGSLFEVFYLGWKPEEVSSWYDNEAMEQNAVFISNALSNPEQLVQIVSTYDDICKMCPYNEKGDNYKPENKPCDNYNNPETDPDYGIAEILGLEKLIDREPVTSKTFFNLMHSTYERLLSEPLVETTNGLQKSLRQIFRVKDEIELPSYISSLLLM